MLIILSSDFVCVVNGTWDVRFAYTRYRSQAEFAKEAMDRQSLAPDGEGYVYDVDIRI